MSESYAMIRLFSRNEDGSICETDGDDFYSEKLLGAVPQIGDSILDQGLYDGGKPGDWDYHHRKFYKVVDRYFLPDGAGGARIVLIVEHRRALKEERELIL